MDNTITVPIQNIGVFADLIAALQNAGVAYHVEANSSQFVITVTGA